MLRVLTSKEDLLKRRTLLNSFVYGMRRERPMSKKYGVEMTGSEAAPFRIYPLGQRSKVLAYIHTLSMKDAYELCDLLNRTGFELHGRAPTGDFTLQECQEEEYRILERK